MYFSAIFNGPPTNKQHSHSPEALWPGLPLLLEGLEQRAPVHAAPAPHPRPGGGVDRVVQQRHGAVQAHVALVTPANTMITSCLQYRTSQTQVSNI